MNALGIESIKEMEKEKVIVTGEWGSSPLSCDPA